MHRHVVLVWHLDLQVLGLAIIPLVDGSVGTFGQAGHHSHPLIMTTELELNLLRDVGEYSLHKTNRSAFGLVHP